MSHAHILDTVHKNDPIGFWVDGELKPKKVAAFVDISTKEWAKITNLKPASVRFDHRIPAVIKEHLAHVANICSLVAELFDNDIAKTKLWLDTPNPALGDISPKGLIRFGKYQKLLSFVLLAKSESSEN